MKKTNFLKGLAMAAIALVSVFTTSCSEEELSIKGAEIKLPAAAASVTLSVVDLEAGELLKTETLDATANIGKEMTLTCPTINGYTTAKSVTVTIPNIKDGQAVNVPVTFYVVNINSAFAGMVQDMEVVETEEAESKNIPVNGFENDSDVDVKKTFEYKIKTGEEFVSFTRVANDAEEILREKLKFGEETKTTKEYTIPAKQALTLTIEQAFETVTYETYYQNEKIYVTVLKAGNVTIDGSLEWMEGHGHDHGHDHGGSNNSGGGDSPAA